MTITSRTWNGTAFYTDICLYLRTNVHTSIYTHTHTYMYIYTHIYIYTYIYSKMSENYNEDTEWNDVLRAKGIIGAKEKSEYEITQEKLEKLIEQVCIYIYMYV